MFSNYLRTMGLVVVLAGCAVGLQWSYDALNANDSGAVLLGVVGLVTTIFLGGYLVKVLITKFIQGNTRKNESPSDNLGSGSSDSFGS